VTVSGSIPGARHLFQYVTNQPPKANSAFHPSGVSKWVPASAGKAKAGMVHSVSRWTRGVQVKLWDPVSTRAIPERLRGAFMTRRYTNPRLPLPLHICASFMVISQHFPPLLVERSPIRKPLYILPEWYLCYRWMLCLMFNQQCQSIEHKRHYIFFIFTKTSYPAYTNYHYLVCCCCCWQWQWWWRWQSYTHSRL